MRAGTAWLLLVGCDALAPLGPLPAVDDASRVDGRLDDAVQPVDAVPADGGLRDATPADVGPPSPCSPGVARFAPLGDAPRSTRRNFAVGERRFHFFEVEIPPGTACLGQRSDQCVGQDAVRANPRVVTLTRGLFVQRTEVTRVQWSAFDLSSPPAPCPQLDCPVAGVRFVDAIRYANALSESLDLSPCYEIFGCTEPGAQCLVAWPEGLDCEGYRLPTEAEWEYAARGGLPYPLPVEGAGCPGVDPAAEAALAGIAWYAGNAGGAPHPVGTAPDRDLHPFGLYDVLGNVGEWTIDGFSALGTEPVTDPVAPAAPMAPRIRRGGGFDGPLEHMQLADRNQYFSVGLFESHPAVGLRLVRTRP